MDLGRQKVAMKISEKQVVDIYAHADYDISGEGLDIMERARPAPRQDVHCVEL